nr:glycoside hydrolase family 55 protein [Allorhizobium borbori]
MPVGTATLAAGNTATTAAPTIDASPSTSEDAKNWAQAVKWYNVREFGAVGGQLGDGGSINAAIAYTHNNRGKLQLGSAEYLVDETIVIPKEITIAGNGKNLTKLKATPAAVAAHKNILETQHFTENTGRNGALVDQDRMTWGISLRGFSIDGGWNHDFQTATTNPLTGRGISIYGRRYEAKDIGVYNCSGIGFYTECGGLASPSAGWYDDYRNNQDTVLEDIDIQRTAYEGFISFGPGDTYINRITVGLVGDTNAVGTPIKSLVFPGDYISGFVLSVIDSTGASGTHEIGVIHTHTCWNGWNFRALGGLTLVRLKAENLIAEGGLGSVYLQRGVYAQISKINTRNNNVLAATDSTAFADVRLSSSIEINIGSIEGRRKNAHVQGQNPALTGVRIDQDKVQIGEIKYEGNGQPGHAVTIEAGRKHVNIGSIYASNCRGPAQDGEASASLLSKPTSTDITVGNLMSVASDYGWRNASTGRVAVLSGHAEVSNAFGSNVAGVKLDAVPAENYIRTSRLTSSSLSGATLKPDCNTIITARNAGLNVSVVGEAQTVSIPHGMWRTPDHQREVSLNILYDGDIPDVPPASQPVGADCTKVTFVVTQSRKSAHSSDIGTVLNLKI